MNFTKRSLPYVCLRPLTDELQFDSAAGVEQFQFTPTSGFSNLVRRDVVPWVMEWPAEILAMLEESLVNQWTSNRDVLIDFLLNADQFALLTEDPESIWVNFYRAVFGRDISEREIPGRASDDDRSESGGQLLRGFDPGEPELLWLSALRQQRVLTYQMSLLNVLVGASCIGTVRRAPLRDFEAASGQPLVRAGNYSAIEARKLSDAIGELVRSGGSPSDQLTDEQLASLRLIKTAARLALSDGDTFAVVSGT